MKKSINFLEIILAVLLVACQEDQVGFYAGPTAVNMTIRGDGTFVKGETDEEKVFEIKLAVQGEISEQDRVLKFAFGKEQTAVPGVNFELPMEVIIEAGRLDTVIECKVYRAGLTEEALMFDLIPDPTGDFVGGVNGELLVKMMIGFPTTWKDPTGWAADYCLGKCTQAKYAFVFEQLGTLDLAAYQGAYGIDGYGELAKKLNAVLEAEPEPRLDDNGKIMKFGNGY